jgi:hypothetical protein
MAGKTAVMTHVYVIMCIRGIDFVSVSMIFQLDFGTVLTVVCFALYSIIETNQDCLLSIDLKYIFLSIYVRKMQIRQNSVCLSKQVVGSIWTRT